MTEPNVNESEELGEFAPNAPDFHEIFRDIVMLIKHTGNDPVAVIQQANDILWQKTPHLRLIEPMEHKAVNATIKALVEHLLAE